MIKAAFEEWEASYPALTNITRILFNLVLEPLPPAIYKRHARENAVGLADRTDSLVIVELFASWANSSDNDLVSSTLSLLLDSINTRAKEIGAFDPFIFANYAGKNQDVIRSYGAESIDKLRQVRQAVDSKGIFTSLVPGGYQIADDQ